MRENFNQPQINYEDFKKSFLDIMETKSLYGLKKHNKSIEELLQSAGGEGSFEDLRLKILQEIENNPAKFIDEYPSMVKVAHNTVVSRYKEYADSKDEKGQAIFTEAERLLDNFKKIYDKDVIPPTLP